MANASASVVERVEPMGGAVHTVDLGYFAPGFSVFLEGVTGSGTIDVEISANGSDWVIPNNATIPALSAGLGEGDNAAHFGTWARYLRFTWTGLSACTLHLIVRKSAR